MSSNDPRIPDETAKGGDALKQLGSEYSSYAAAYASHWSPIILPMGLPLLEPLPLETARVVLDLGSGTGGLLPHLRRRAIRALIIGIDYAPGMLALAPRAPANSLAVMDAQSLGLASQCAQAVVLMFVLFHVPRPERALAETARVLDQEGALGIATWAHDPGLPGAGIWAEELERVGAPPDPRDPSVMQHELVGDADRLNELLRNTGLAVTAQWSADYAQSWTADQLIQLQTGCGLPRRRLDGLSAEAQRDCGARVHKRLRRLKAAELIWRPRVLFTCARKRDP